MESFIIEGGHPLKGTITPQGAKNEALEVICATILTSDPVRIKNIPDILDVNNLILLLKEIGVKVTKNTTIKGIRYKFNKNGICTGKYTGFVKNSKGMRYYKNGVLIKEQTVTVKGLTYYADSFGYLTGGEEDGVNPGSVSSTVRDLRYNGSNYYLFIETVAFIYGDDGKCYDLGDFPDEVSKSGYKLKSNLREDKELTSLIKDKQPLGQLTYTSKKLSNNFEITVKEFDKANLYANGKAMEDYGLTLVSTNPFCYVDGTAVYLYTTAAKY